MIRVMSLPWLCCVVCNRGLHCTECPAQVVEDACLLLGDHCEAGVWRGPVFPEEGCPGPRSNVSGYYLEGVAGSPPAPTPQTFSADAWGRGWKWDLVRQEAVRKL